jgi:DNA-binding MarR family transcriptional regulator
MSWPRCWVFRTAALPVLWTTWSAKKLVTRRPSEEDRRCWFAIITDKGKNLPKTSQQTVVGPAKENHSPAASQGSGQHFKALKAYVEQYEAVLKATYVEL